MDIRITKLSYLLSSLLLLISLFIILLTQESIKYEISIYEAYPFYLWIFLILTIFISILALIFSSKDTLSQKYSFFGISIVLLANFILLILPLIRNYYIFGNADVLSHFGYILDILKSGYLISNMYPIYHILAAITTDISNLNIRYVLMIFPPLFFLFYIVSFYLLYKQLFKDRIKSTIAIAFTLIPVLSTNLTLFAPFTQSILLIPFFLYFYFKSRMSNNPIPFSIITLTIAVFITFFHPLTIVIIMLILGIIEFSKIYGSKILLKDIKSQFKLRNSYTLIAVILVIFFSWQFYAYLILNSLQSIFGWLIGESAGSQLQNVASVIDYGQPNITQLLKSLFNIYGQFLIIGIFSILSIVILLKVNKKKLVFYEIFSSAGFLMFFIWSIFTFSSVYIFGFTRIYSIALIFANFLIFSLIYLIMSKNNNFNHEKLFKILMGLLILTIIYFSVFNLYFSPIINYPNPQVTKSEIIGMETFFENRDKNFTTMDLGLSQDRFYDAIYSTTEGRYGRGRGRFNIRYSGTTPIDHFGYDNYTSVSNYYNETQYLIINEIGREMYPTLYPDYKDKWRFTPSDFQKLSADKEVQFIYNNGNLEIFKIRSV